MRGHDLSFRVARLEQLVAYLLQFAPKVLQANPASFDLTGAGATLRYGKRLVASTTSFTLTGQAATLRRSIVIAASATSFALTGQAATIVKGKRLAADASSFALTGQASTLRRARKVVAATTSYALTGQAATLTKTSSVSRTYRDFQSDLSAASTGRTVAVNGGARTGKVVVIVTSRRGVAGTNVNPSGVTFNGVALSPEIEQVNTRSYVGIWISDTDITSDGTDTIVATWASLTQIRTSAALYSVDGLSSTTAIATNSSTSASPTLSVNTNAGGVAFGGHFSHNTSDVTWSGLTEDQDATVDAAERASAASLLTATASTPLAISASLGSSEVASVAASFR